MIRPARAARRPTSDQRFAWMRAVALRFLALSAALVSYGSIPSTIAVQSEVESVMQEEFASAYQFDVRHKLRGAALRRAGSAVAASHPLRLPSATAAAEILPNGSRWAWPRRCAVSGRLPHSFVRTPAARSTPAFPRPGFPHTRTLGSAGDFRLIGPVVTHSTCVRPFD